MHGQPTIEMEKKCVRRRFGTINFNIIFATFHRLRYFSSKEFQGG
jgi:hypothetical protein